MSKGNAYFGEDEQPFRPEYKGLTNTSPREWILGWAKHVAMHHLLGYKPMLEGEVARAHVILNQFKEENDHEAE